MPGRLLSFGLGVGSCVCEGVGCTNILLFLANRHPLGVFDCVCGRACVRACVCVCARTYRGVYLCVCCILTVNTAQVGGRKKKEPPAGFKIHLLQLEDISQVCAERRV